MNVVHRSIKVGNKVLSATQLRRERAPRKRIAKRQFRRAQSIALRNIVNGGDVDGFCEPSVTFTAWDLF